MQCHFFCIVVHFGVVIGGDWGSNVPVRVDTVTCICELSNMISFGVDTAGYRRPDACKVIFLYNSDDLG